MFSNSKNTGCCIFCTYRCISAQSKQPQAKWKRFNIERRPAVLDQAHVFTTSIFPFNEPSKRCFHERRSQAPSRFAKPSRSGNADLAKQKVNANGRFRSSNDDILGLVLSRLEYLSNGKAESPLLQSLRLKDSSHGKSFARFKSHIISTLRKTQDRRFNAPPSERGQSLYRKLQSIVSKDGVRGLDAHLKYEFYGYIARLDFSKPELENHVELVDLRYPSEWYPKARSRQRDIHLHVGPTNSGKTYHALKRLEQAEAGVYAGPLRLLAQEVFTRMNSSGKRCILVTGEERRSPDEELKASLVSCTVEMMPMNAVLDVAVIDEIQMIGSPDRGWAWTQAFLGVNAKEVHLCGEERAVPLIQELSAFIGDRLHIHKYDRLSPLEVMWHSLNGNLKQLKKGDCIVSFSVMGIHSMKQDVEKATGRKVAIVYGSLPPETRAQQARLFNDPNNDYDFLVASDAIGMGLNLSIKRIIFESVLKYDGNGERVLSISEIKQIAGRAGRYRTASQATEKEQTDDKEKLDDDDHRDADKMSGRGGKEAAKSRTSTTGLVTTMEREHLPLVKTAMFRMAEPIKTAGILPPSTIVQRFSSYFPPDTPFSYILLRLHDIAQRSSRFHLCALRDQLLVADAIHPVKELSIRERITFCAAPISTNPLMQRLIKAFATYAAEQKQCSIVDVPELPLEVLDSEKPGDRQHLRQLEDLHKGINLYLWLSYRFHGVYNSRMLAFYAKKLVEAAIERSLAAYNFVRRRRSFTKFQENNEIYNLLQKQMLQTEKTNKGEAEVVEETERNNDMTPTPSTLSDANEGGSGLYETEEPIVDEPDAEDVNPSSSLSTDGSTSEKGLSHGLKDVVEARSDSDTGNDVERSPGPLLLQQSSLASVYEPDADTNSELDFHDEFKAASPQWTEEPTEPSEGDYASDHFNAKDDTTKSKAKKSNTTKHEDKYHRNELPGGGSRNSKGKSKIIMPEQRKTMKTLKVANGSLSNPTAQVTNVDALASVSSADERQSRSDSAN